MFTEWSMEEDESPSQSPLVPPKFNIGDECTANINGLAVPVMVVKIDSHYYFVIVMEDQGTEELRKGAAIFVSECKLTAKENNAKNREIISGQQRHWIKDGTKIPVIVVFYNPDRWPYAKTARVKLPDGSETGVSIQDLLS